MEGWLTPSVLSQRLTRPYLFMEGDMKLLYICHFHRRPQPTLIPICSTCYIDKSEWHCSLSRRKPHENIMRIHSSAHACPETKNLGQFRELLLDGQIQRTLKSRNQPS